MATQEKKTRGPYKNTKAKLRWDAIPDSRFVELVPSVISIRELLGALGMSMQSTSNYRHAQRKIAQLGLDISHFKGQGHGKTIKKLQEFNSPRTKPLSEILVEQSNYDRAKLKKRLLKEGLLEWKCSECGVVDWNGRWLALELDHINGVGDDNRIENLRLLCPNCHSQTITFGGRKRWYS